jgi:hypothetical protein
LVELGEGGLLHGLDRLRLDVSLVIELVVILSELFQSVSSKSWLTWLLTVAQHCLGYSDALEILVSSIELLEHLLSHRVTCCAGGAGRLGLSRSSHLAIDVGRVGP